MAGLCCIWRGAPTVVTGLENILGRAGIAFRCRRLDGSRNAVVDCEWVRVMFAHSFNTFHTL